MGKSMGGRRALVVGALLLATVIGVGVATAQAPEPRPSAAPSVDVAFTPLVPAKVVLSGTIGANSVKQVVVSGGTTTVPSNATTIQMTVTSKGAQAGSLSFYPSGNPAGTSGQTVTWAAGGSGSATITTDVGQKNSVAFRNNSGATATVKATVTGWSTDVEADDVSSLGGTTGQVLTDTGAGAAWQAPQAPAAYYARTPGYLALTTSTSTVATLTVPAGTYQVEALASGYVSGAATGYFGCHLYGPAGGWLGSRYGNVDNTTIYNSSIAIDGLVRTDGGALTLRCVLLSGAVEVYERTILATQVGPTSGPVQSTPASRAPGQPGR